MSESRLGLEEQQTGERPTRRLVSAVGDSREHRECACSASAVASCMRVSTRSTWPGLARAHLAARATSGYPDDIGVDRLAVDSVPWRSTVLVRHAGEQEGRRGYGSASVNGQLSHGTDGARPDPAASDGSSDNDECAHPGCATACDFERVVRSPSTSPLVNILLRQLVERSKAAKTRDTRAGRQRRRGNEEQQAQKQRD